MSPYKKSAGIRVGGRRKCCWPARGDITSWRRFRRRGARQLPNCSRACSHPRHTTRWASTSLTPVAETLNVTSSVFLQFFDLCTNGHLVGRRWYVGHRPRSVEVYAEGVYNLDPVLKPGLQWLRCGAAGQNAFVTLFSGIPGWRDQTYYRDFLIKYDIRHVLALAVPVRSTLGAEMMCLGFHRAHEAQPFSTVQIERLQKLVPVIHSVISNLAYRESVTLSGSVLDSVSDSYAGMGLLILDQNLLVGHPNRRGLTQLGLYGDAGCRNSQAANVFG